MGKAADSSKTGLLTGEQARNILLQTGGSLPSQLPLEVVPHQYKHLQGSSSLTGVNGTEERAGSVAETAPMSAASFEDRRRMNWEKGQQELERRRRELLERQQAEKEAQFQ